MEYVERDPDVKARVQPEAITSHKHACFCQTDTDATNPVVMTTAGQTAQAGGCQET